jgi:selenocysteine lyase/cysteine desulfurase
VELRPFQVGGSGVHSYDPFHPMEYPTRLEAGTLNTHGIAGLSAALDYLEATGLDRIRAQELSLRELFYRQVKEIPGVTVYGDFTRPGTAIVSLNIGNLDSAAVADELAEEYDIAVRPGAHCAPEMHRTLGTTEQGAVRFSFSVHNTADEVHAAVNALRDIAAREG